MFHTFVYRIDNDWNSIWNQNISIPFTNGCWTKNRGIWPPKMDGENNGSKPYFWMDDLGVFPIFLVKHPNVPGSKLPLFPYSRKWSSTQVRRGLYTHEIRIPSLKVGGVPSPIKRNFWPWHHKSMFLSKTCRLWYSLAIAFWGAGWKNGWSPGGVLVVSPMSQACWLCFFFKGFQRRQILKLKPPRKFFIQSLFCL